MDTRLIEANIWLFVTKAINKFARLMNNLSFVADRASGWTIARAKKLVDDIETEINRGGA